MSNRELAINIIDQIPEYKLNYVVDVLNGIKNMILDDDINSGISNSETLAAIKEVEDMQKNPSKYKSYTNVDEMMEEILNLCSIIHINGGVCMQEINELDSMCGVSDDELDRRFLEAVRIGNEIKKIKGVPISKYDYERKLPYLEYADGRREYAKEA